MKKHIIIIVVSLLLAGASHAQFTYGPKLGFNTARFAGDKIMPGFQAGGFVNAELEDRIGIQIDFLWTMKGNNHVVTVTDSINPNVKNEVSTKTYYRFVDVPFCIYFPITKHIRGFAGPQLSIFRKAHETTSYPSKTYERDIAGITSKVSLCAGFDIVLDSPISIGIRFVTNKFTEPAASSSTTVDSGTNSSKKLNCIMVNVGYRLDW